MTIQKAAKRRRAKQYPYDVCLSFAGEDRAYVHEVAEYLSAKGISVFYDRYEQIELWGKNLYEHLDHVYRESAKYCVMFVSRNYAKKLWTNHERKSAQARAFHENAGYILPVRLDSAKIPGILDTIGYVDIRDLQPGQLGQLITRKLAPYKLLQFQNRVNFVPPEPDKLYELLKVGGSTGKEAVYFAARSFMNALSRLDVHERRAAVLLIVYGCPHDIPKNVHIELDLLRRLLGWSPSKVKQVLSGVGSLGFDVQSKKNKRGDSDHYLYMTWSSMNPETTITLSDNKTSAIHVARAMVDLVRSNYCEFHALEQIMKGNFSSISTVTTRPDKH